MSEKTEFVTIELSKKQVDLEHIVHNDKTDKDYARVYAPNFGTYFYPIASIKVKQEDPSRVYFTRPVGTEIQVQYSSIAEDSTEENPKYEHTTRTWKIEDLKAAYEEERREYAENNGFANITVPTAWGRKFHAESGDYISISVPIPENDGEVYYSFIVAEDRFRESTKEEGMSYFGFPKKVKDTTDDYMVNLRASIKTDNGYEEKTRNISSMELKEFVEKAVSRNAVKDLFVTTLISEKLVRPFSSNAGKELCGISVPVYEGKNEKATFFEIVVPVERVGKPDENGQVQLSLFKNSTDGTEYNHVAKHSVKQENGEYDTISINLTSQEVIHQFEVSKERYMEANNHANDMSLADVLAAGENQASPRRRGGR